MARNDNIRTWKEIRGEKVWPEGTPFPFSFQTFTQAAEPTIEQLADGEACWWINSGTSALMLCYNQAGTVKSVALA